MNPKFYRLPPEQRFAKAVQLRGYRVRVTTREPSAKTYQGRLLAVGVGDINHNNDCIVVRKDTQ
jgi:hypothetical protein